jgi:cell division protein FtsW (lipid II flippase)
VTRPQALAALLVVVVALWVVDLVRRRRLSEEYSLLSLAAMAGVLVVAFWTAGVTTFTRWFGALYETSVIFFFGLVFVMVALVYYATKMTRLTQEVRRLAQDAALLRLRLERAEGTSPETARPHEERP